MATKTVGKVDSELRRMTIEELLERVNDLNAKLGRRALKNPKPIERDSLIRKVMRLKRKAGERDSDNDRDGFSASWLEMLRRR